MFQSALLIILQKLFRTNQLPISTLVFYSTLRNYIYSGGYSFYALRDIVSINLDIFFCCFLYLSIIMAISEEFLQTNDCIDILLSFPRIAG